MVGSRGLVTRRGCGGAVAGGGVFGTGVAARSMGVAPGSDSMVIRECALSVKGDDAGVVPVVRFMIMRVSTGTVVER